jgi:23S rRNA pseudouridine2604 synthase
MGFSRKIKYFLVHTLKYNNKEAQKLIDNGQIRLAENVILENSSLDDTSEIKVKEQIVRKKIEAVYFKFYKPSGFESSLNETVPNNLSAFFIDHKQLAIAGRLDKQSEGLLLLSNDGKWVEKICHPEYEKEKEYEVILDKVVNSSLTGGFQTGIKIGNYLSKPALCEIIDSHKIRVVLKEGKNRQIRRMCRKLGFEVLHLKRIRIDRYELGELSLGESIDFKLFTVN